MTNGFYNFITLIHTSPVPHSTSIIMIVYKLDIYTTNIWIKAKQNIYKNKIKMKKMKRDTRREIETMIKLYATLYNLMKIKVRFIE